MTGDERLRRSLHRLTTSQEWGILKGERIRGGDTLEFRQKLSGRVAELPIWLSLPQPTLPLERPIHKG